MVLGVLGRACPAAWLVVAALGGCSELHPHTTGSDGGGGVGVACMATTDCADDERCDWPAAHACGTDGTPGSCVAITARVCPELAFPVCGCDGVNYTNECFADAAGAAIAYGGPCRPPGSFMACSFSAFSCPDNNPASDTGQTCIDDPRDTCTGSNTCRGLCVHAASPCSATTPCSSMTSPSAPESPGTQACIAGIDSPPGPDQQGRCVYTSGVTCKAQTDCNTGEVCAPPLTGSPSVCVRP
ncbi:MAG TPA: hypothetical protein VH165_06290 [Kofleriaceae bacterium]|jgi:hypothetical protein|nr:hypothetical protein [Kofleriaceae bacterium]